MKSLVLYCSLCTCSAGCLAQSQLRIAEYAKGPVPADCALQVHAAQTLIARYPHPDSWTFVVICDEPSWKYAVNDVNPLFDANQIYGVTLRRVKTTFLRGTKLLHSFPGQPSSVYIVAHELAHIMLNSEDEATVTQAAAKWMAERNDFDLLAK